MDEDFVEYISPELAKAVLKHEKSTVGFLVSLMRERHDIEAEYTKKLHGWVARNQTLLDKADHAPSNTKGAGSRELGACVRLVLQEGSATALHHDSLVTALQAAHSPTNILKSFLSTDGGTSSPKVPKGAAGKSNITEKEDFLPVLTNFQSSLEAHVKRVQDAEKALKKYKSAKTKLEAQMEHGLNVIRGTLLRSGTPRNPQRIKMDPQVVSAETRMDVWRDKYESFVKKEQAEREAFLIDCQEFEEALVRRQTYVLTLCSTQISDYVQCLHQAYTNRKSSKRILDALSRARDSLDDIGIRLLVSEWQSKNITTLKLPHSQTEPEKIAASTNGGDSLKEQGIQKAGPEELDEVIDVKDQIATLASTSNQVPKVKLKKQLTKAREERDPPPTPPPKPQRKFRLRKPKKEEDEVTHTPVEVIGKLSDSEDEGSTQGFMKPTAVSSIPERPPPLTPLQNAFECVSTEKAQFSYRGRTSGSSSSHSISVESLTSDDDEKNAVFDLTVSRDNKRPESRTLHRHTLFKSPETPDVFPVADCESQPNVAYHVSPPPQADMSDSMKAVTSITVTHSPAPARPPPPKQIHHDTFQRVYGSMIPDLSSSSQSSDDDDDEGDSHHKQRGHKQRKGKASFSKHDSGYSPMQSMEEVQETKVQYLRLQEEPSAESLSDKAANQAFTVPKPFSPLKKGAFNFTGLKSKKNFAGKNSK